MHCFVCLLDNKETLPIYGKDVLEYNISDMIDKHLNLKPYSMDGSEICVDCWNKLTDFHEYYENVRTAHEQLETISTKSKDHGHDSIIVKEEFQVISPNNSISNVIGTEDMLTGDPFLSIDLPSHDTHGVKEQLTENGRQEQDEKDIESENSTTHCWAADTESDDSEDSKPLANVSRELQENNTKQSEVIQIREKRLTRKNTPKQRKCHLLLEQNEQLIKKHIHMLCQICNYICDDFKNVIAHYKAKHTDTKPHIICCDRKLDCPSDVLQHAYYHEDPNYFKCNECGRSYKNNSSLKDHYRRQHAPETNFTHKCDQCPRKFARKHLLEHHKSKHVPVTERSHFCDICVPRKAFATEYILQIHVKNRHYKPVNVCHVCAKEIHDKQAFEKHVRSHFETSGPRIKCPREGCERWLKDKDNLRQHLRRFHDTKQYKCPQCERICKNKHSLTCHLNFTHNTQEYTCEECHKNFKSQQTLREHMAGHAGEPLYNCPFCSRKFNSKANMYSHKKKAHPVEWKQLKVIGSK